MLLCGSLTVLIKHDGLQKNRDGLIIFDPVDLLRTSQYVTIKLKGAVLNYLLHGVLHPTMKLKKELWTNSSDG